MWAHGTLGGSERRPERRPHEAPRARAANEREVAFLKWRERTRAIWVQLDPHERGVTCGKKYDVGLCWVKKTRKK